MSKIDELKEKHKDDWVGDSIHHWNTVRAIHIETFNKILEELRPLVELGEIFSDKYYHDRLNLIDDLLQDKVNELIQQIRSKQPPDYDFNKDKAIFDNYDRSQEATNNSTTKEKE